jgi:hypothetical protein
MTRRRLWLLTTACCGALAMPTVLQLIALAAPRGAAPAHGASWLQNAWAQTRHIGGIVLDGVGRGAEAVGARVETVQHWLTADVLSHWRSAMPITLGCTAAALVCGLVALMIINVRGGRRDRSASAAQSTLATVMRLARQGTAVSAIASRTGLAQDAVRQLLRPRASGQQEPFAELLGTSLDHPIPSTVGSRRTR